MLYVTIRMNDYQMFFVCSNNYFSFLFQWVGTECGHHATYTFYKAVKFASTPDTETLIPPSPKLQTSKESWKVLSLGQFFFVKIWAGSDLLSVAELQLLWEDKDRNYDVTCFLKRFKRNLLKDKQRNLSLVCHMSHGNGNR